VARIRPAPNAGREAYRQHRNKFRNSIIILAAAAMLGAVALEPCVRPSHGGFRMVVITTWPIASTFFTPGIDSFSGIRSSSGAILL
jgi:hypothetical protein